MNYQSLKTKLLLFFKKIIAVDDTPHKIASGVALGVFLGIFPGMGVIAAIFIATLFKFNKVAAVSGALITNTWISVVMVPLVIWLVSIVFNIDATQIYHLMTVEYLQGDWQSLIKLIFSQVALPLTISLTVLGLIAANLAYLTVYISATYYHRSKR